MNHKKRATVILGSTVFSTALLVGTALANPSEASATCENGITGSAHDYPNINKNTVAILIDNVSVNGYPKTFSGGISFTVQFTDKTVGHTWTVIWDRWNGTDGDRTQNGIVEACEDPIITTTSSTLPIPQPIPSTTTTTTSIVDQIEPPVPTTTEPEITAPVVTTIVTDISQSVPVVSEIPLPVTGNSSIILWIALALVLSGVGVTLFLRKKIIK